MFDKKSSIDSDDESDEDSDDNEIEKVNNKLSDLKIDEKKTPQKGNKITPTEIKYTTKYLRLRLN